MRNIIRYVGLVLLLVQLWAPELKAQELDVTINLNTQQIEGTKTSVFESLRNSMMQFLNERNWTGQQYANNERIKCTFSINVNKFSEESGLFTCEAYIQSSRPVFNSTYMTTTLSLRDKDFNFEFHEYDQLEFRDDQIDNALTALMAYYAYLIIGIDLDTMSPLGGTEILQKAMTVANNAQSLNVKGWKAFDDVKNRFGIINDYLDGSMEPFRQMQYIYHRKGLDQMVSSSDEARAAITEAIGLLKTAKSNKSLSSLPQLFSEYKRDELVGIYNKQETSAKKQDIYDFLVKLNAAQSSYWKKILE